jgi:hypothetical protein
VSHAQTDDLTRLDERMSQFDSCEQRDGQMAVDASREEGAARLVSHGRNQNVHLCGASRLA